MNIKRETTVICANPKKKSMKTNIPAIYRDIMGLKKGDKLLWEMTKENEIKITKKDD